MLKTVSIFAKVYSSSWLLRFQASKDFQKIHGEDQFKELKQKLLIKPWLSKISYYIEKLKKIEVQA